MRLDRSVGLPLLFVALVSGPTPSRGADSAAEAVLKEKGLTKSGRAYVIEAEEPVLAKMKEVRAAFADYATTADRQAKAEHVATQAAQLEDRRAQLQEELDAVNERIASQGTPQNNNFARPGGTNPQQGGITSPLISQRDQIKYVLAEITRDQRTLKSEAPQGKKASLDEAVKTKGDAFKTALAELRPQVDAVMKTYAELGADESVQKALVDVRKASPTKLKLGPSDAFLAGAKELDQAERRFLGKKTPVVSRKKAKSKR
jgi:exonuclease VII large subunit